MFIICCQFWAIFAVCLVIVTVYLHEGVYSQEYTGRGIPRALARGPSY